MRIYWTQCLYFINNIYNIKVKIKNKIKNNTPVYNVKNFIEGNILLSHLTIFRSINSQNIFISISLNTIIAKFHIEKKYIPLYIFVKYYFMSICGLSYTQRILYYRDVYQYKVQYI